MCEEIEEGKKKGRYLTNRYYRRSNPDLYYASFVPIIFLHLAHRSFPFSLFLLFSMVSFHLVPLQQHCLSSVSLSLSLLFTLTRDTRIRIERGGTGAHTLSPTADLATRDSREAASENDRFKKNVFLFVSGICNRVYEVARRTLQEEVRRRK